MTREEYNNKNFENVMEQLNEERDDITTYETLKEFAKEKIEEDNLLVAIHILEALQNDDTEWYEYDYCMGTLQTPSGITEKEHVEHMILDDEEVGCNTCKHYIKGTCALVEDGCQTEEMERYESK